MESHILNDVKNLLTAVRCQLVTLFHSLFLLHNGMATVIGDGHICPHP